MVGADVCGAVGAKVGAFLGLGDTGAADGRFVGLGDTGDVVGRALGDGVVVNSSCSAGFFGHSMPQEQGQLSIISSTC